MKFAAALLLLVFSVHYGTGLLAAVFPDPAAAERALFYVGQGLKGCALFAVVAALAPRSYRSIPLWAVCAWGFAEDAMVFSCRLAKGIQNAPALGDWQSMCEVVTETRLFTPVLVFFGLIAASAVGHGASFGKS